MSQCSNPGGRFSWPARNSPVALFQATKELSLVRYAETQGRTQNGNTGHRHGQSRQHASPKGMPTLPLREHSSCKPPLPVPASCANARFCLPGLVQRLRKSDRRKSFLWLKVNYPPIFAKYAANLDERPQGRSRTTLQVADCIQRYTASLRQHLLRYIGLQAMRSNTCTY